MTVAAVIVAGGTGERFGSPDGKQLAMAAGKPVLAWSVAAFDACEGVDAIVVVADPGRMAEYAEAARSEKLTAVVPGGATRQDSVVAGLGALPPGTDVVAVHDGARPLVTPGTVLGALEVLAEHSDADGVVVGHPVYDTVKLVEDGGVVRDTLDRRRLWAAQTPQVFRLRALLDAHERARSDGFVGTDDAQLVERAGGSVVVSIGPRENIKVTVPEDIVVVEAVLESRRRGPE